MQPIALCYGTRPQVIKASVLRRELSRHWPLLAVDTGQHYDFALNELLYRELEVASPDHFLEVGSSSHAVQTATILMRMEPLLQTSGISTFVADWSVPAMITTSPLPMTVVVGYQRP